MKARKPPTLRLALLLGLLGASTTLALDAGGFGYTKSVETIIRTEPRALAPAVGRLGYHKKVKIDQSKGLWLRVSDGPLSGWVFSGSLSDTMPPEVKGTDGLPLNASQTTASAAPRPLTPEAEAYASRRNLGFARNDLNWLQSQCRGLNPAEVENYLQTQKKGEYQ